MFYFRNFKGFADVRLNLEQPVTVLIGPNGSGKSNAIEAIELLSFLTRGQPLHEVTDLGRGGALEIRGGLASCSRVDSEAFVLGFEAVVPFEGYPTTVKYEVGIRAGDDTRIVHEWLELEGRDIPIFDVVGTEIPGASADNEVRYDNFAPGRNKPKARVAADRSALSQYARFATANRSIGSCLGLINSLASLLEAAFVFDPVPKLMRGYERRSETVLARNGFNVSPVLFNLTRPFIKVGPAERWPAQEAAAVERRKSLVRIRSGITQVPDEPFSDFDFIRTRGGDVMVGFRRKEDRRLVDARLLSDGTLRTLAILTALETGNQGSRVVIEEFDNGVHPSRVRVLTHALSDSCQRRKLRALVTTHNPATLNELLPEQIDGVVFSVWNPEKRAFDLVELKNLPRYVEFMERGKLGDLVTKRIVEQHLAPGFSESQKAQALDWLNQLT